MMPELIPWKHHGSLLVGDHWTTQDGTIRIYFRRSMFLPTEAEVFEICVIYGKCIQCRRCKTTFLLSVCNGPTT